MATVTLKGAPYRTAGDLPRVGSPAPAFALTADDLSEKTLAQFKGKRVVLNIYPSLDTSTCATSVRKFNEAIASRANAAVLCISADLPFANKRFCSAEGIRNVVTLSTFRDPKFGVDYGVRIVDGPLAGLMSRAVVVVDETGKVIHSEQVSEIVDEPNYEAALSKL